MQDSLQFIFKNLGTGLGTGLLIGFSTWFTSWCVSQVIHFFKSIST